MVLVCYFDVCQEPMTRFGPCGELERQGIARFRASHRSRLLVADAAGSVRHGALGFLGRKILDRHRRGDTTRDNGYGSERCGQSWSERLHIKSPSVSWVMCS